MALFTSESGLSYFNTLPLIYLPSSNKSNELNKILFNFYKNAYTAPACYQDLKDTST